jgi:hypothetical protein
MGDGITESGPSPRQALCRTESRHGLCGCVVLLHEVYMAKKKTITMTRVADDTKNYAKFRLDKSNKESVEPFGQIYVPKAQAGEAQSVTITFNEK